MAIRLTIDRVEFVCDTADEAAALARLSREANATYSASNGVALSDRGLLNPSVERLPNHKLKTALAFLRVIQQAPKSGVTVTSFIEPLDLKHPKGIGGVAAHVNRVIMQTSQRSPEDVYSAVKYADGKRRWKSGDRLDETINIIEAQMKGET